MICPAIQRIDTRAFAAAETTTATAETIAAAITAAPHLYLPDPGGAAVTLIIGSPRQPPRAVQLIPHHADLLFIAAILISVVRGKRQTSSSGKVAHDETP